MWRYFEKVVAPEVQARQPSRSQVSRPKVEVLLEHLVEKKPSLSKVSTSEIIYRDIYTVYTNFCTLSGIVICEGAAGH